MQNNELIKTPLAYIGTLLVATGSAQLVADNFAVGTALLVVAAGIFILRGYLKQVGKI